jgi:hypothetical protein
VRYVNVINDFISTLGAQGAIADRIAVCNHRRPHQALGRDQPVGARADTTQDPVSAGRAWSAIASGRWEEIVDPSPGRVALPHMHP